MNRLSKALYTKEALLKAAYAFTDTYYIHLDEDESDYQVTLYSKENNSEIEELDVYMKFENEIISQQTRYIISKKSKNIREMIVARALSSTMIGKISDFEINDSDDNDELMRDWFEKEENA